MDISSEKNKTALIKISQFVLREESGELRADLQEEITETALFWGSKEGVGSSISDIELLIREQINLTNFTPNLLNSIIPRLVEKGRLVEEKSGFYKLSTYRKQELAKQVENRKMRVDQINGQFILLLETEFGKKLTNSEKEIGVGILYSLFASLMTGKSDLIAKIITHKNLEDLPLQLSVHKLFTILGKIEDIELRNAEYRAIKRLFRESSDDFYTFLFELTQNFLCLQILNLDPDCQALEKKAFSEKVLFLDTNVLIGLICPTDWQHKPAKNLLALSRTLGVKFCVIPKTCEEYNAILEEANRIFHKWEMPFKFLESADNEFLVSFWSEKQANQSLEWDAYYQRTKDVGAILSQYEIELFTESLNEIIAHKQFSTVKEYVNECYQLLKQRGKSPAVCEHDAALLMLIRNKRTSENTPILGPNHWLITADETLLCVDNKINFLPDFVDKTPSSMLYEIWLDMISPFLSLNSKEGEAFEAFTTLVKYQFALVPLRIDTQKLIKIQGEWTRYEWLDAKDIIRIQNQDWTKDYLHRLDKIKLQKDKDKAEQVGKIFANKLNEELALIKDDKVAQLAKENRALLERESKLVATTQEQAKESSFQQKLIESQKATIGEKESVIQSKDNELVKENTFRRKLRTMVAALGLLLVIFTILIAILTFSPMTFEKVSFYSAFLIAGAILLFFGIAPERVVVAIIAKLGAPSANDHSK